MKIDICNKGESLITVFWNHECIKGYGLLFLKYLPVFSNKVFSSRQNSVPEIFHFYYVNNTFIIASLYLAVFNHGNFCWRWRGWCLFYSSAVKAISNIWCRKEKKMRPLKCFILSSCRKRKKVSSCQRNFPRSRTLNNRSLSDFPQLAWSVFLNITEKTYRSKRSISNSIDFLSLFFMVWNNTEAMNETLVGRGIWRNLINLSTLNEESWPCGSNLSINAV